MASKAEARPQAASERVYPLAMALNPKPNRSIRKLRDRNIAIAFVAGVIIAVLLLLF